MWHSVAPPSGGVFFGLDILHLVARFAVHVPYLVAVDNSPPSGVLYLVCVDLGTYYM